MRNFSLTLLLLILPLGSCKKNSESAFTGELRIVTPFTQPSIQTGRLYLSKGRLRVDLGPMVTIYIAERQKGWQIFPGLKQYLDIGEKQVSTFWPHLTNGSPCPNSQQTSECRMVAKENIGGRPATKWELVNQHNERIYLWTDDQIGVALRWEIENVTYELSGIHETKVTDDIFELPTGYSKAPANWGQAFGSSPNYK
jgi:hypothetical protein